MINEHENIIIGVKWDDIDISVRKLWGWLYTEHINISDISLCSVMLIKTLCLQLL
jgi:hypothetical protein